VRIANVSRILSPGPLTFSCVLMAAVAKRCFKCGVTRLLTEFYAHREMADGHLNKCKTCTKRDVRAREARLSTDPKWRAKERARKRGVYQKPGYVPRQTTREERARYLKNRDARHPELAKAYGAVARALRAGRLIRPASCDYCGVACKPDAHHADHRKRLEVTWLCKRCHGMTRRLAS
jgi:hypothetical protein